MQTMSESEKEIMKIIWNNGNSIYISELLSLVESQGFQWERTTVRTFLARLMDKGFVTAKKQGKMAEYIAEVSEEEYLSKQAKYFVNNIFNGSVKGFLTSLFGQTSIDQEALDNLEEFWASMKEENH